MLLDFVCKGTSKNENSQIFHKKTRLLSYCPYKLTGKKNTVLNATVDVGEDATLPFEVTDGWGEYKITFTRPSSSDAITVTDLAIHSLTDEEVTKVGSITMLNLSVDGNSRIYDISGNQHSHPVKGINIINNKKVIVNRK